MLPADTRQIADRYMFIQADLDSIAQCRGDQNRMGFAITPRRPSRNVASLPTVPPCVPDLRGFSWGR